MAYARINTFRSTAYALLIATTGGISSVHAAGQFAPQGYNVEATTPAPTQGAIPQPMPSFNPSQQMNRPVQQPYQMPRQTFQGYPNQYQQQYSRPYMANRPPMPPPQRRRNNGMNNMPWNNSGMTIPMLDGNFVPWSSDVWNWQNRNRNFGAFGPFEQGPQQWVTSNPKNGLETMWDDMVNAPHNMGTMPGNWQAPSVSFPNPVDLADQVGVAGKTVMTDAPEVVQDWVTPTFTNE